MPLSFNTIQYLDDGHFVRIPFPNYHYKQVDGFVHWLMYVLIVQVWMMKKHVGVCRSWGSGKGNISTCFCSLFLCWEEITRASAFWNISNVMTFSSNYRQHVTQDYSPNTNTPPKFNSSPLKNDGWKMILSYWEGNFSGAMLNFGKVINHYSLKLFLLWASSPARHRPSGPPNARSRRSGAARGAPGPRG